MSLDSCADRSATMSFHPWISVKYIDQHLSLWVHARAFQNTCFPSDILPSITSFVGDKTKSSYLASLLGYARPFERHGQVRVAGRPCKTHSSPDIYLDCEISLDTSIGVDKDLISCLPYPVEMPVRNRAVEFPRRFISNIITPLSSIICYFAQDLNGVKETARILAQQALLPPASTLPQAVLPHVLVVTTTVSKLYDTFSAQHDLRSYIIDEMMKSSKYASKGLAEQELDRKFRGIHIIGLQKNQPHLKRVAQLKQRLMILKQEVYLSRRAHRYLFEWKHIDALSHRMIQSFCKGQVCFNYLQESRSEQFDKEQLESHFSEILKLLPSASWLWPVVVPLISSASCLASYPHGSHSMAIWNTNFDYIADFTRVPSRRCVYRVLP